MVGFFKVFPEILSEEKYFEYLELLLKIIFQSWKIFSLVIVPSEGGGGEILWKWN